MPSLLALVAACVGLAGSVGCNRDHEATPAPAESAAALTSAAAPSPPPPAAAAAAKGPYSCDQRKSEYFANTCIDFMPALIAQGEDKLKKTCSDEGSVLSHAPCPTEGVVGSCEADKGLDVWRYYSGGKTPYTEQSAKAKCVDVLGGKPL
jgi:hypothetical protein